MKSIQLLIPMSGQGTRYQKAGYKDPKPLIPVNGTPMIERLLQVFPTHWTSTFVMAENHKNTGLPNLLKKLRPEAQQIFISQHHRGPSEAIKSAFSTLRMDDPVLVSYCDYGMIWDPQLFQKFISETDCDAALVSYKGFHAHYLSDVTYAYSRMEGDLVKEVKEKGSFTNNRENEYASCGAYYFKSAKLLQQAVEHQEKINLSLNNEFYTSLTVEALLRLQPHAQVRIFEIPYFFQWGTPADLKIFEYWEKCFQAVLANKDSILSTDQVLMPMAGFGQRFQKLFSTPKPFLKIHGEPMYIKALKSLPKAKNKTVFVATQNSEKFFNKEFSEEILVLPKTPEGQALTVQAGLSHLQESGDLIISSCDHEVVISKSKWEQFQKNPRCEAAIFTIRGFPGTVRRPEAFAFVETEGSDLFPIVKSVSVKKPISESPDRDPLLVGTFWFCNKQILQKGLEALIRKNPRVNNELYLDSIFDILKELGLTVRTIELDGYINWGDPDSMSEALYWSEVFLGKNQSLHRTRFVGVTE